MPRHRIENHNDLTIRADIACILWNNILLMFRLANVENNKLNLKICLIFHEPHLPLVRMSFNSTYILNHFKEHIIVHSMLSHSKCKKPKFSPLIIGSGQEAKRRLFHGIFCPLRLGIKARFQHNERRRLTFF